MKVGSVLLLSTAVLVAVTQPAVAAPKCVDPSTTTPSNRKVTPPVVLSPESNSTAKVVNFDAGRDGKTALLHVKVDPALPPNAERSLRVETDQLANSGNPNAETVDFPDLQFTTLDVSPNRQRISFRVCLNPSKHLPAGRYSGAVSLDGPAGVEAATMTLTANAKDGMLFLIGTVLTLALAFLVLLYKAAAETRTLNIEGAKAGTKNEKQQAAKWLPAVSSNLSDLGFEVRSWLTLGATFVALYALWEANPAWGEAGPVRSLITLIGVGLAAVGARAIINPSTTPTQSR